MIIDGLTYDIQVSNQMSVETSRYLMVKLKAFLGAAETIGYAYLKHFLLLLHVWQKVPNKVLEGLLKLTTKPQPLPNAPLIHLSTCPDKTHHLQMREGRHFEER